MKAFTQASRRHYGQMRKRYAHMAQEWLATDGRESTVANSEPLAEYACAVIATAPARRTALEIAFLEKLND
jgi:hypothetical protein